MNRRGWLYSFDIFLNRQAKETTSGKRQAAEDHQEKRWREAGRSSVTVRHGGKVMRGNIWPDRFSKIYETWLLVITMHPHISVLFKTWQI